MDKLKRLVYIRVPDLGDGMDRATKKKMGHKRVLSGDTTSGDGSPRTPPRTPSNLCLLRLCLLPPPQRPHNPSAGKIPRTRHRRAPSTKAAPSPRSDGRRPSGVDDRAQDQGREREAD
ncbi:hypothetical protein DXG01_001213 [Tephrocybe rancida]|nr:hypothetical protein DXG01_001213 [Tephrocybe rancida]